MTRRFFLPLLCAPLAAPLLADSEEVLEVLTAAASALSEGNPIAFLGVFDHEMPGYEDIAANVSALTSAAEIVCSIDILAERGDDFNRAVESDWFLQIRSKAEGGPLERRREIVKVQLAKRKKKWIIVGFSPATIVAPMKTS